MPDRVRYVSAISPALVHLGLHGLPLSEPIDIDKGADEQGEYLTLRQAGRIIVYRVCGICHARPYPGGCPQCGWTTERTGIGYQLSVISYNRKPSTGNGERGEPWP